MKQVLSVQSLSCFGKSSLTVALPVLSAMGCGCTVLPTAVLSTHTGYPDPHRISMTADIPKIAAHWHSQGITFDAVATGYLADPRQAEAVLQVVETFGGIRIIDPAMGDGGRLYRGLTPEHVPAMEKLCRKGDILLPNVTEAALLTGLPYEEIQSEAYLTALLQRLLDFGVQSAVITGVTGAPGSVGFRGMHAHGERFSYETAAAPGAFHGTGDLFCAVLTGSLMAGNSLEAAARLGADFVGRVLRRGNAPELRGLPFEGELPWLWQRLSEE